MINTLVTDLIRQSESNIDAQAPAYAGRGAQRPGADRLQRRRCNEQQRALKTFLRIHLYRHYRVLRMSAKAQRIISDLFGIFMADSRCCRRNSRPGRTGPGTRGCRLHRRHDRPLCDARTSPHLCGRRMSVVHSDGQSACGIILQVRLPIITRQGRISALSLVNSDVATCVAFFWL